MNESKIGTKLKAFCSNCKGERNCEVNGHHHEGGSDGHIHWWRNWYLLVCCGCDHVFAQSVYCDSEIYYPVGQDSDGNFEYDGDEITRSWPARFKRNRPNWLDRIDHDINHERSFDLASCLLQIYEALDHDLNIFAAIGIRTAFDVASEILGIEDTTFKAKLDGLEKKGLVTPSQRDNLEVLVNAGNASAHRGWNPSFQDLDPIVDTLEHFINDAFVVPRVRQEAADAIAKIKAKVPSRPRKGLVEEASLPKSEQDPASL